MIIWLNRMHPSPIKETARLMVRIVRAAVIVLCLIYGPLSTVANSARLQAQDAPNSSQKAGEGLYKQGCRNLGLMNMNGVGMAKDELHGAQLFQRAVQLYQKGWDGGEATSCAS